MKRAVLLISLLASLLFAWRVLAHEQLQAADDTHTIAWHTIDNGDRSIGNGTFALNGSSGQPDAALLSNDTYTLVGGF